MSQGAVRRKDKEMSRAEIEDFLGRAAYGHIASTDEAGQPYVIPDLFVYAEGKVWIHTSVAGHFQANIERNPRVCFEASEMGTIFPYGEFECDTTVSYASVVGFGRISVEAANEAKARFFDRFMAKYGDPKWPARPKGFYPRLDHVTVYRIDLETVTGKKGPLPQIADRWPAKNLTKSPGAKPPRN